MSSLKEVRNNGLDKFYTMPSVSKNCILSLDNKMSIDSFDCIVEPSAGNGSFSLELNKLHRNVISLDIEPENESIKKQDFFDFSIDRDDVNEDENQLSKNILTIGNPPFGKISSLAIKFFNHASSFSNVIAFIIPKTFRKDSVQRRLNLNFHLMHDEDIPDKPCSFIPKMNVKCCFQIWIKKDYKRLLKEKILTHEDFKFINFGPKDENNQPTPPEGADFAIRAYGSNIGKIFTGDECLKSLRPKSYHWVKSNIDVEDLIKKFETLNYEKSINTARQCSIGKSELIELYVDK